MNVHFVIGCAVLGTACTHTQTLNHVNELAGGAEVTVDIAGYGEIDATTVPTARGMAFRANDGGDFLDPAAMTRVTEVRRGRGALEGFLIGAGISAATFAMLGYADGDDECTGFCLWTMSAGDKAALGAVLGGISGGFIGLIVGAVRGSRFVYESNESIKVTPSGPPGSAAGMTITF